MRDMANLEECRSAIGLVSERITQLDLRQAEVAAGLAEAEQRFAVICSSEIADVVVVDGVEPGVDPRTAARRLLAGTQPPREDATNVMERAHREILLDGLRAGHDPSMPKLDGVSVLRQIKQEDPDAMVVMVSAVDQKGKLTECIQLGAADFIVKPFDKDRLRSFFARYGRDASPTA